MKTIKFYTMKEYCNAIKEYFEGYSTDQDNIDLYGDSKQKLKDCINDPTFDELKFIVCVEDIVGSTTRVLRGKQPDLPFLDWIGDGKESFSREYFVDTMKTVWPDL